MNEEELKALMAKVDEQIKDAQKTATEESEKTIEALKAELGELGKTLEGLKKDEEFKAVKAELIDLQATVKALKENGNDGDIPKTSYVQIFEQLTAAKESLVEMKGKKGIDINLTIKAAGTMTTGNVTPVSGGLSMLLNQFEQGITPFPRTQPFFLDLFRQVPTTGLTVSYAEMKNPDGGAGMTGEGSAKTQADFDIIEAKADVKKVTSFIKTSKEALEDIAGLAGEINGELNTLVKLKADSQAMIGDGTGNNLNGVITVSPAFTGGALALSVEAANNYDVLVAAITEIAVAEVISGQPAGFNADTIVMNPNDIAVMNLTKDQNDNYIFPVALPNRDVMNVPIVANARMASGDFLVMDSTKVNYRLREGFNINIGYENDDFTKNLVTILGEMRLTVYVKSNHLKALIEGDFTSAKALLETI